MTVIYKPLFQAVFYGHMRENNWSHICEVARKSQVSSVHFTE